MKKRVLRIVLVALGVLLVLPCLGVLAVLWQVWSYNGPAGHWIYRDCFLDAACVCSSERGKKVACPHNGMLEIKVPCLEEKEGVCHALLPLHPHMGLAGVWPPAAPQREKVVK